MSLAIAICTRSRPDQLVECLASVDASALVDQVIVSGDGVDPETDEIGFCAQERSSKIVYTRGPRLGLAANRNAGLAAVTTDYVLFLDDDTRLRDDFLAAALPIAGPRRLVTGWELRGDIQVMQSGPDLLGFQRRLAPWPKPAIVMNSTIFPTAFLRRVPFDEFYRFGSEEADIAMAAVANGLEIAYVDAGNVHVHVAAARDGNDLAAIRSRAYFSTRRFATYERSWPRLLAALPLIFMNAVGDAAKANGLRSAAHTGASVVAAASLAVISKPKRPAPPVLRPRGVDALRASVVVPTYRRPEQLKSCLDALELQLRPPHEVIVVRRRGDHDAAALLASMREPVCEVVVTEPGQVAALLAGARVARGDIVAFLDDDAVPRRDWLDWLVLPYANPLVGGVGGRDVVRGVHGEIIDGAAVRVGTLSRWGRTTGNHHLGVGRARQVDILKGVNCSYRRALLRLPIGLRGAGAQVANDLATSLRVGACGHRLIYEPRALVDHRPARRFGEDRRDARSTRAILDAVYNETYAIASVRPELRRARVAYALAVGDRSTPGVARTLFAHLRGEEAVQGRLVGTARSVVRAAADARARPLRFAAAQSVNESGALNAPTRERG